MQTIKCVVVGDGAVGKVRRTLRPAGVSEAQSNADVLVDIVHYQQIPKRICANCEWRPLLGRKHVQTVELGVR